eukprot:1161696-Pelagomonas_calceolata.AAC.36
MQVFYTCHWAPADRQSFKTTCSQSCPAFLVSQVDRHLRKEKVGEGGNMVGCRVGAPIILYCPAMHSFNQAGLCVQSFNTMPCNVFIPPSRALRSGFAFSHSTHCPVMHLFNQAVLHIQPFNTMPCNALIQPSRALRSVIQHTHAALQCTHSTKQGFAFSHSACCPEMHSLNQRRALHSVIQHAALQRTHSTNQGFAFSQHLPNGVPHQHTPPATQEQRKPRSAGHLCNFENPSSTAKMGAKQPLSHTGHLHMAKAHTALAHTKSTNGSTGLVWLGLVVGQPILSPNNTVSPNSVPNSVPQQCPPTVSLTVSPNSVPQQRLPTVSPNNTCIKRGRAVSSMHLLSNIKNPAGTKQGSIAPRKAAKGPWSIKQGSIAANAANEPRENCSLGVFLSACSRTSRADSFL